MFKFLRPDGTTVADGKAFVYNLPGRNEKWARTDHPDPLLEPDGYDCGPGGLHLMKHLDAKYAPSTWWVWWARPCGTVLGESDEKIRSTGVELRRITPEVFAKCLRFGWGKKADLHGADLRWADLHRANLRWANLHKANLNCADLRWADLRWADLRRANLRSAALNGAYLKGALMPDGTRHD